MKKIALYSLGGLILVGLTGFWVYSFLYGSPTNDAPLFADFDFFGGSAPAAEPLPVFVPTEPVVDVTNESLRQLTTKPVAGMAIVNHENKSVMRYIEAGTGHVYDIDLNSGEETQVTNISIPFANYGVISPDGDYAIISGGDRTRQIDLILIDAENSKTIKKLGNDINNFAVTNDYVFYTKESSAGVSGHALNISTLNLSEVFNLPFREINVIWGNEPRGEHLVYTKPAEKINSFVYSVLNNQTKRLNISGQELMISRVADKYFISVQDNGSYKSFVANTDFSEVKQLNFKTIAQKCSVHPEYPVVCAAVNQETDTPSITEWYQGSSNFIDQFFVVDSLGITQSLSNPLNTVGRNLDVLELKLDRETRLLYFINKYDGTLWTYDI